MSPVFLMWVRQLKLPSFSCKLRCKRKARENRLLTSRRCHQPQHMRGRTVIENWRGNRDKETQSKTYSEAKDMSLVLNENKGKYILSAKKNGLVLICTVQANRTLKSFFLQARTRLQVTRRSRPVKWCGGKISTLHESVWRPFEVKVLRKVYGPLHIGSGKYRSRWNDELYEIYDSLDIV